MAGAPSDTRQARVFSLVEQIAGGLAQSILGGEFDDGASLTEEQIAQRFGVSRTPVREAFRMLANEHLLVIAPRRGVRAVRFDAKRVVDIYQLRSRLYGLSVAAATQLASDEQLALMSDYVDAMGAAARKGELDDFLSANISFHETAEAVAGNDLLSASLASLGQVTIYLRARGLRMPGRMAASYDAHREVMAAMLERRAATAELLTRRLILEAGIEILRADYPGDTHSAGLLQRDASALATA